MNADRGLFRHIAYASRTDVGKRRKNNEDALGAFPKGGIFCVADGMGGGDDGEIASAAVVKAVGDVAARCATGVAHAQKDVVGALESRLDDVSAWIWKRAQDRKISMCGSTFVGVLFGATAPARALALHAGDSRVYLLHRKSVKQITRDHSAVELMGEKDERKVNPIFRSMIVNAVGIRKNVDCEQTPFKVADGDRVLICSDGLYRMVPDDKIGEISRAHPDVEQAVNALVEAALAAGGVDNISVVLCEIGKLPGAVSAEPLPPVPAEDAASADSSEIECPTLLPETNQTVATVVPIGAKQAGATSAARKTTENPPPSRLAAEGPKAPVGGGMRSWRWLRGVVLATALAVLAGSLAVLVASRKAVSPSHTSAPAANPPRPRAPAVPAPRVGTNAVARPAVAPRIETNAVALLAVAPRIETNAVAPLAVAPRVGTNAVARPPAAEPVSATNAPRAAVQTVRPVPVGPKPSVKQAGPVGSVSATNVVPRAVESRVCAAWIEACGKRPVEDCVDAIRRLNVLSTEALREFDEQVRRFRDSAKLCSRMKSETSAVKAATDFKYLLLAADPVKACLAERLPDPDVQPLLNDWTLIASESEKDRRVHEACARFIRTMSRVKRK